MYYRYVRRLHAYSAHAHCLIIIIITAVFAFGSAAGSVSFFFMANNHRAMYDYIAVMYR
jgi:hypothetical protein